MQKISLLLIRFYQRFLSRYLGSQCKFYPSCSEYAALAIKKYGPARGAIKTFFRLLRCNPFSNGGVDFP